LIEVLVTHDFHAHVYYDGSTYAQAAALCGEAGDRFDVSVGRKHKQAVGPHPKWSCQLAFKPEVFGELVPWLALNRNGLTVFIHPNTGDEFKDHTEHSIWMGQMEDLNVDIFKWEG